MKRIFLALMACSLISGIANAEDFRNESVLSEKGGLCWNCRGITFKQPVTVPGTLKVGEIIAWSKKGNCLLLKNVDNNKTNTLDLGDSYDLSHIPQTFEANGHRALLMGFHAFTHKPHHFQLNCQFDDSIKPLNEITWGDIEDDFDGMFKFY